MGEIATLGDVASRLGRPLTPDEEELAETLVSDAENLIRARCPGRVIDLDVMDFRDVKQVVGYAVVRVLRNPDGYRSESAGGVSYSIDTRAAAGFLLILADEWRLLGLSPNESSAGSFAPTLGLAHYPGYPRPGLWL